jgi:hypothetical protein
MDNTAPDRQWVTCPGCAESFDPDTEAATREEAGTSVQCPFCSTRFTPTTTSDAPEAIPSPVTPVAGAQGAFVVLDDELPGDDEMSPHSRDSRYRSVRGAQELSTARVRDLSAARRALIRIRSWCVVGALVSAVAVVQMSWLLVQHVRQQGWFWKPGAYAALVPVAAYWTVSFARRAAVATRELRRPVLQDPDVPPDFSTLSDGSQQWKNLEGM